MLIDMPAHITNQLLLVPVLFEIHGQMPIRFVDVLVGRVSEAELRTAVGDLWIPGGQFFVADSLTCVQDDGIVPLRPGVLIRLLPPGRSCRPLLTLQDKLLEPKRHFRTADGTVA